MFDGKLEALRLAETPFALRDGCWNHHADEEFRRLHAALETAEASDRESLAMYRSARDRADRLHALCDEMGEALMHIVEFSSPMTVQQHECWPAMCSALAKWKESK